MEFYAGATTAMWDYLWVGVRFVNFIHTGNTLADRKSSTYGSGRSSRGSLYHSRAQGKC